MKRTEKSPDGTFVVLKNEREVFRAGTHNECQEYVDQKEQDERQNREHLAMLRRQGLIR